MKSLTKSSFQFLLIINSRGDPAVSHHGIDTNFSVQTTDARHTKSRCADGHVVSVLRVNGMAEVGRKAT